MNYMSVSPSPHLRVPTTTKHVMRDVLIALTPALIAGVYHYGPRALLMVAVCVAACVAMEYIYRRLMKLDTMVGDLSAVVTGVLLAYCLPVNFPFWMAIVGCFFSIIIAKQLFGGLGKNFANPAIMGRIVLLIAFPSQMTDFSLAGAGSLDAVSGATPLLIASSDKLDLFTGRIAGCIGETSALALILGFAYLMLRCTITVTIPLSYCASVFVLSWLLGGDPVHQLLSGGLLMGAIFMATDYVTSPITERGKLVYGIGCGLITVIIRFYGSYPEGVSFAILLMNILSPHISKLTRVRPFGVEKKKKRLGGEPT